MLEEEFVPYNLAKQIKQLGFKQECFGYYIDVEVPSPFLVKNIISDDQGGYFTLAPTFFQAFRFFREKYKLEGYININDSKEDNFHYYFNYINTNSIDYRREYCGFFIGNFNTYEEAELECLKKLIEICKNQ